jgi:hypothetical protein
MSFLWSEKLGVELNRSHPFRRWLQVLARPAVFHALSHLPTREHLLTLLDAYRSYAQFREPETPAILPALAQMEEHMSSWSPPDLPAEIVDAARALIVADGFYAEFKWEKGPDLEPGRTLESTLVWPSEQEAKS